MEQIDLLIEKGFCVIEHNNKGQELRKQWGESKGSGWWKKEFKVGKKTFLISRMSFIHF